MEVPRRTLFVNCVVTRKVGFLDYVFSLFRLHSTLQFHLRAYCFCSGAMALYLYTRVLALFSAAPYLSPSRQIHQKTDEYLDLAPHLTNTSLQTHRGEEGVRLLNELIGCHLLSEQGDLPLDPDDSAIRLEKEDVEEIIQQISHVLAETFKAAQASPVHFQVP